MIGDMLHWTSQARGHALGVTLLLLAIVLPNRAAAQVDPVPDDATASAGAQRDTPDGATTKEGPTTPLPSTGEPPTTPIDGSKSQLPIAYTKTRSSDAEPQPEEQPEPSRHSSGVARMRWLIHLALVHNTLSSDDFNDSTGLLRPTADGAEGVLLPTLGSGNGFLVGVSLGWDAQRVGSAGFSTGLTYSATWLSPQSAQTPAPLDAMVLHELELPLRVSVLAAPFLRPYLQASYGLGFFALSGVHASANASGVAAFDSNSTLFAARSLGFGLGTLFRLGDHLSVDALVGYRVLFISSVDGTPPPGDLGVGGWTLRLGPTFFL